MPRDITVEAPRGEVSAPDDLRSLAAGLDRLQTDAGPGSARWRRITESVVPPIVFVLLLLVAWQAYVVLAQPRPDIVPSPVDVANALGSAWDSGRLQEAVATSLERGVVGFLIAIAVGTPIGLLLAEVRPIRRAVGPIISGLQVLPSVAWVPAAIIWFGLSDATVYFVILMGAIPSIEGDAERLVQIPGAMPRLSNIPQGCAFNPRCSKAFARCHVERPELIDVGGHQVACHLYDQAPAGKTEIAA